MIPAALLLSSLLAVAHLIWDPPSADLAAQAFRAELFADHGFLLWNNEWYAGHHLPGYSVLFPPLAAALDERLVGAIAAVAAAGLFAMLARGHFGRRAWLGSLWFALGSATLLFTGRLTFVLGVALGLAALVGLQRRRGALAATLAIACALASPVAGLFLALAAAAVALGGSGRPRGAIALGAGAALTVALLAFSFPAGGEEPFVLSAFVPVPLFAAVAFWLLPEEERVLGWGVALYFLLAVAAFLVPSPLGGNAARLGALFGGPLAALVLAQRRPAVLALVALPLLYWQWVAPVRDVVEAAGDPATERSYYEPLLAQLDRRITGLMRVQVLPTRNRWEAAYVAPRYPLARGWLRQLESDDFELFRDGELTPASYRDWLDERGVGFVALPRETDLDYLAEDEAELIESGLPFLEPVWSNRHWLLLEVRRPQGLVEGEGGRLTRLDPDSFELEARRAGAYLVRVRYTPYWSVRAGKACVESDGEWTRVRALAPGPVRVAARLSLDGLLRREPGCSG